MTAPKKTIDARHYGVSVDRARRRLLEFVRKRLDPIENAQEIAFRLSTRKAKDGDVWVDTLKCVPGKDEPEWAVDELLRIATEDMDRLAFVGRMVYAVTVSGDGPDGEREQFPLVRTRTNGEDEVSSPFHADPQGILASVMDDKQRLFEGFMANVDARIQESERNAQRAHERANRTEALTLSFYQAIQVATTTDLERRLMVQRYEDDRDNRSMVGHALLAGVPTAAGLLAGKDAAEKTAALVALFAKKDGPESSAENDIDAFFAEAKDDREFLEKFEAVLKTRPRYAARFLKIIQDASARRARRDVARNDPSNVPKDKGAKP